MLVRKRDQAIDGRTRAARQARDLRRSLVEHVGGKPTAPQRVLIDQAVQLSLRLSDMDARFTRSGGMTDYDSRMYLSWSNSMQRLLRQLGLKAAPAPVREIDWSLPSPGARAA